MDQIVGGPSIASVNSGTPSSSSQTLSLCPHGLTGMQSDSTYSGSKSSNCTGESNGCVVNGYEETHETLQNGFEEFPERRKKRIRKMTTMDKDIISLMGQHLRERGYSKTLDCLIEESGCTLEHPKAACFRSHVALGQWKEAIEALDDLSPLLGDPYCTEKMRLLLLEEKYLEHLENGERLLALQCLRNDLASLPAHHPKRIQDLSQYIMCQSREELYRLSNWPGVEGGARQRLMDQLQAFLPASIMLPPKRLELLLRQSVQLQVDKCPFHYMEKDISCYSLLTDHICSRSQFPSETVHTLKEHNDEVWFVQFSHNGNWLASGCKDGSIIIWNLQQPDSPRKEHVFKGQSSGVTSLAWSPDDTLLLSCGAEDCPEVFVFSTRTGEEKCRVSNAHDDSLTCSSWHHSGRKFYVGGLRGQFYECSPEDGSVTNSWEGIRLHAVAAHPYNNLVFAADSHMRIRQYNFEDRTSSTLVKEEHPIMALSLSKDARYALLNVASQGVHMWDLSDRCIVHRFQGVTQGFYTIHSCFGVNDSFIASGSEDHHVYVWNQKRETPVVVLQGHSRTVNCVCWNPVHHSMIASGSDDCAIRLWGTESEMKHQRELQKTKEKETQERKKHKQEITQNGITEDTRDDEEKEDDDDEEEEDEDDDDEDEGMETQGSYERLSRPISESDLQALEMLDPDSSSQEENSGSVDRLEAAVSLSALSVGLSVDQDSQLTINPQTGDRQSTGASGMLVIMSAPVTHTVTSVNVQDRQQDEEEDEDETSISLPPLLSQPSLEQESRSFDLDSSMESEESRHLESLQSVLSETDPSSDRGIAVITSLTGNVRNSGNEEDVEEREEGSLNTPHLTSGDNSNGTSSNGSSDRLREGEENVSSIPRTRTTESSISTVV